jgi:hypothetical protein
MWRSLPRGNSGRTGDAAEYSQNQTAPEAPGEGRQNGALSASRFMPFAKKGLMNAEIRSAVHMLLPRPRRA